MNDETNREATNETDAVTAPLPPLEPHDEVTDATRPFFEALVDLGTEWAALGISFGVQALDRSARSLKLASKTLALVSRKLEESRPGAAVTEVEEKKSAA